MLRVLPLVMLTVVGCGGGSTPQPQDPIEIETGFAKFGQSEIYYEVAGSGEPTVVLIHGGLLDCRMWDDQFEILSNDHRVVRYDASAHGQSALPADAYWDHADLRGLLDYLAIDQAVLVGLSLGGRIAIDLTLEDPKRVQAVVAVSSGLGGYRFTSEDWLKDRDAMMAAWKAGDFENVVEAFQRSWTDGPHRMPEEVDPLVREQVRSMARNKIESAMEGRMLRQPAIDRLSEIEVPMLVVVGELDVPGILEIADLLVDADPNAELVVVPGVAHMVNMEKPEDFNRILLDYLERF